MTKPAPPKTARTIGHFLADLERQNQTLAAWARAHQFDVTAVYDLSRGRIHGRRGQAREILKAMGIEPPPMFGPRPRPTAKAA